MSGRNRLNLWANLCFCTLVILSCLGGPVRALTKKDRFTPAPSNWPFDGGFTPVDGTCDDRDKDAGVSSEYETMDFFAF